MFSPIYNLDHSSGSIIMFPELNTTLSISSVLMFAILGKEKVTTKSDKVKEFNRTLSTSSDEAETVQSEVKYFNPQPSMVASGLCSYKFIVNRAVHRIPGIMRIKLR